VGQLGCGGSWGAAGVRGQGCEGHAGVVHAHLAGRSASRRRVAQLGGSCSVGQLRCITTAPAASARCPRAQDFERDARAWPNYATDYRPLLELARREGLAVVAANAPRRYVSLAGRQGRLALQQLPAAAAAWLPPLPYAQPSEAYVRKVGRGCQGGGVGRGDVVGWGHAGWGGG
jgi:hypothetical protein